MRISMHFLEISMIFFCPGNLGKDLRVPQLKKRLCWKEKCLLISLSQLFTILHLSSFKKDLEKPKKACM